LCIGTNPHRCVFFYHCSLGTVADGKGGSQMSQSRKAWQAGIEPDWSKEADGDEITAVVRRLFDYANHVTGYNMSVDGQENLMSIQYFGEGVDDPTPDRYMPHCGKLASLWIFVLKSRPGSAVTWNPSHSRALSNPLTENSHLFDQTANATDCRTRRAVASPRW